MSEQEQGLRFEIWLERVLSRLGYQHVLRNVEYHRGLLEYRQADILYDRQSRNRLVRCVWEAKYSANGPVRYELRDEKHKHGQLVSTIDNVVDEFVERLLFVRADIGYLATNKRFEKRVLAAASHRGIYILQEDNLASLSARAGLSADIQRQILRIDPGNYNTKANIIRESCPSHHNTRLYRPTLIQRQ